ncbi:MAG: antitoxin [Rickettsia endosymbiont of Labidopullus appendiculatus]|nr:antitoxin [Rickettsia endosymbiont of Labidopullus appendiculatus]
MPKVITVTDMVRSFSDIIGRVHYQGESFDIKKGTNIVARLVPTQNKPALTLGELNEFFENGPHLSEEDILEFKQEIAKVKKIKSTGDIIKWD